jgi:hypothetical protein
MMLRDSDLSSNGTRWLDFEFSLVFLRLDFFQAVHIFCHAGILATISRREMQFSTLSAVWRLHYLVFLRTVSCKWMDLPISPDGDGSSLLVLLPTPRFPY